VAEHGADGHRRHFATAGGKAVTHKAITGVFPGTRDEAGLKREITDIEWLVREWLRDHEKIPIANS